MAKPISGRAVSNVDRWVSLSLNPSYESHLIASGLTGEPTAPVIGIAGATNMNS